MLIILVVAVVLCVINLILSGVSLSKVRSSKSNFRNIEQVPRNRSRRNPARSNRR
jgi:hypothetical protein